MAVGFAHLFKTNPWAAGGPKGQLFGVVFILVIIRLLRVRIRERFIVQRKVDFQRFVRLPSGNDTRNSSRSSGGICRGVQVHSWAQIYRLFSAFSVSDSTAAACGREWRRSRTKRLLPMISPAGGGVFGNDPVCRFVTFHPPQAEKRHKAYPHGKGGQQPQRPVHRSSALGCREATASRSSKNRSMVSRLSSRCAENLVHVGRDRHVATTDDTGDRGYARDTTDVSSRACYRRKAAAAGRCNGPGTRPRGGDSPTATSQGAVRGR